MPAMQSARITEAQAEVVAMAQRMWGDRDAELTWEIDDDGTLLIVVVEDELRQVARYARNGDSLGDWF